MCRFTVYSGAPVSPDRLVYGGSHPLVEQAWAPRELLEGEVNADGYGVVWYPDEEPVRIARARPIWHDPDLEGLLASVRSGMAVASIRNATEGMPLGPAVVAPIVHGRWSFVLNGFVREFGPRFMRRFHAALSDELYGALRTTSDTEALFRLALEEARGGAAPGDALAAVVAFVRRVVGREDVTAHMNMVLTDGRTTAVTRTSTVEATNSLYMARSGPLPAGGTLVASEALDEASGWEEVAPHTLLVLDRDGGLERRSLEE